KIFTRTFWH
ncbi:Chorismate synthase, partial [Haemophilus influenzae]